MGAVAVHIALLYIIHQFNYNISMIQPKSESESEPSMSSGRTSPVSDISDISSISSSRPRLLKPNRMASDLFSAPVTRLYQERRSRQHGDDSFNTLFGSPPSHRSRRPLSVNTITGQKIGLKQTSVAQASAPAPAAHTSAVMKVR